MTDASLMSTATLTYPLHTLPSVSEVNFADTREVCAYVLLLIKTYEKADGLSFPKPRTRNIRELEQTGKELVKLIEKRLMEAPLSDILDLSQAYDLPCRIFEQSLPGIFLQNIFGASVRKWITGDKSISISEVALIIRMMMEYNPTSIPDEWAKFYFSITDGWLKELGTSGHFQDIPLKEAYLRLIRLMKDDIKPLNGGSAYRKIRKEWIMSYLVEDLALLDTNTLEVYAAFIYNADFNRLLDEKYAKLGKEITSELLSRPDLHPFNHRALEFDRD